MMLGIALLAALAAGFAASFIANEIMPVFQDARDLREAAQRPIVGMVSMLSNEGAMRRRRRNAFVFAGGIGALVAWFSAFIVFALLVGRAA
jgi:putative flippase GtrA